MNTGKHWLFPTLPVSISYYRARRSTATRDLGTTNNKKERKKEVGGGNVKRYKGLTDERGGGNALGVSLAGKGKKEARGGRGGGTVSEWQAFHLRQTCPVRQTSSPLSPSSPQSCPRDPGPRLCPASVSLPPFPSSPPPPQRGTD